MHRYEQESKTQFVVDAVYAFAHALHNLHNDLCTQNDQNEGQRQGQQKNTHPHSESVWYRKPVDSHSQACPDMASYDGKDFYNHYLLNVSFIGTQPIYILLLSPIFQYNTLITFQIWLVVRLSLIVKEMAWPDMIY